MRDSRVTVETRRRAHLPVVWCDGAARISRRAYRHDVRL